MSAKSFMSVTLFVRSVRKEIAITLCLVLCGCFVSGCVGNTSSQNQTSQGSGSLRSSEISLGSASASLGEPVSIKAVLKDSSGKVLNGKVVEWFIDGRSIGKSQMKNDATTLSLTGEYTENLGLKLHQTQVNFYGDATYKSSTATSFLNITATPGSEETTLDGSLLNASVQP